MTNDALPDKLPTLHDVAERAGVSHITVSRVVTGKNNVSPETRRRVMDAMQELGYVPNPAAQALQSRRARVIELISTDLWGVRPGAVNNLSTATREANYQFSIQPTTLDSLYSVLESIPNRLVAGIVLHAQQPELDYDRVAALLNNIPFVHMGGRMHSRLPSVAIDYGYGARLAVQHLIDQGHRHIAHIAGTQSLLDGLVRYESWHKTLSDNGLHPGPLAFGDFAEDTGAAGMREILDSKQRFTAVFAASDAMAIGAIDTLYNQGIRVPEDVSFVGFDDVPVGSYTRPRLTTVSNDMERLASVAIEYLLQQVDKPEQDGHQRVLTPRLIVRNSTSRL